MWSPECLEDSLVVAKALEDNFGELAKWFESFQGTDARGVIGFDLAMELCGCYAIVLARLGRGISDMFGGCKFTQSARGLRDADRALQRLEAILTRPTETDPFCEALSLETSDHESEQLQTALGKLAKRTALSSALEIQECFDEHWTGLLESIRALVVMVRKGRAQLLDSTTECIKHRRDLDSARDDVSRLRGELATESEIVATLTRARSITSQSETGTAMQLEEAKETLQQTQARCDRLCGELTRSQDKCEQQERCIHDITLTHERNKEKLLQALDKVHRQLTDSELTLARVKEDRAKEREDLNLEIIALTERNENLLRDMADLESAKREAERRYAAAQQQRCEQESMLSHSHGIINDLQCRVNKGEEIIRGVQADLVSSQEEQVKLTNEIKRLVECKGVLASLCRFVGVDTVYSCWDSLQRAISAQMDASVDRIDAELKQTCVKRAANGAYDIDEHTRMEVVEHTGGMFRAYEDAITNVIRRLDNVVEPRPKTARLKRKSPGGSLGVTGRQGSILKTLKDYGPDETKLPKIEQTSEPRPLDITSQTCHNDVHAFDIDSAAAAAATRGTKIPSYIAKTLCAQGDLKVIDLGHEAPLGTLLRVLQAEDLIPSCAEPTQSKCHCQDMDRFSNSLKCTLLVCWTPSGHHEAYGGVDRTRAVYTIIVHKQNKVRKYYLVAVKPHGHESYIYNFGKVPFETQYDVPCHTVLLDGTCRGPGSTVDVVTLTTQDIVLRADT